MDRDLAPTPRVDAAMQSMKPPRVHFSLDRRAWETEPRLQLSDRNHPVLPIREVR